MRRSMIDAGFAKGDEKVVVTEREMQEMAQEEWELFTRFLTEPTTAPGLHISAVRETNLAKDEVIIRIQHDVPCVTTLR